VRVAGASGSQNALAGGVAEQSTLVVNGFDPRVIRAAYEVVADDYLTTFGDDLDHLPLDRRLLDRVLGEHPDASVRLAVAHALSGGVADLYRDGRGGQRPDPVE
jgi:hypothetical protein